MDLHKELVNNSLEYLIEINDRESLEAAIMSVVELGFDNFNTAGLADLNRKYGRQCPEFAGMSVKALVSEMVKAGKVLIVAGNKNNFRVVPAELWLSVYSDAYEEGEAAVRTLMDKYINI